MWLKGEGGVRAPLEMDSGQVVPVFVVKHEGAREAAHGMPHLAAPMRCPSAALARAARLGLGPRPLCAAPLRAARHPLVAYI